MIDWLIALSALGLHWPTITLLLCKWHAHLQNISSLSMSAVVLQWLQWSMAITGAQVSMTIRTGVFTGNGIGGLRG